MKSTLLSIYDRLILERPLVTLLITLAVIGFFITQIPKFKLDASGDSLVLEGDAALRYHRGITERYGSKDVLVVTYSPKGDIFAAATLADIKTLRDKLRKIEGVESVTTILDVPLLLSSGVSLWDLADAGNIPTLEDADIDMEAVKSELRESPLYRGRLLSNDGKTTTILVSLPTDETHRSLLKRRYELREKKYNNELTHADALELARVSKEYRRNLTKIMAEENRLVESVRRVMDQHRDQAKLYLGGVPMIVTDMISFIKKDLVIFGLGVGIFLIITLTVIFRQLRWVVLPVACCSAAVLTMLGYLGMVDWRVTVISSNFISLMIILTMSLTIHIIQRYLEIHTKWPDADQRTLVKETVRTIALPCFYTTLTTIVAFTSLLVSDIRPVMDFGKMMTIGLITAFVLAFILFPTTVMLLKKVRSGGIAEDFSHSRTLIFARFTEKHGTMILITALLIAIVSGLGIARLKVENRFIDYFRKKTEIYQGMSLIDRELGGTTPMDVIIDFKEKKEAPLSDFEKEEDPFADVGVEKTLWFADVYTMEQIEEIHDYLDGLTETGEVLSIATAVKVATKLNNDAPLDNFELALMNKKSPEDIKEMLISPYVSEDISQARFSMRIVESDKNMERKALLEKIQNFLTGKMGLDNNQIHFTNMFVLYNNMLESLFRSQILTIGVVFLGIMIMFIVLFRSFYLAAIATIPNMLPVAAVLGTLGWLKIPLDMMTITISSITIGIAVDDTIHYVHRFQREFKKDRNYLATMYRCHSSIGKAMYYTSITITIGFSILVLSNFIPTIYFGLFTGFAMVVALLADLTLLPKLLMVLKPLGPEK